MWLKLFITLSSLRSIFCFEDYGRLHSQVMVYPDHDVPLYYGLNSGTNYTERFCLNNRTGYEVLLEDEYARAEYCPEGTRCDCWYNEACQEEDPCRAIPTAVPMINVGTFQYESESRYYFYYTKRSNYYKGHGVVKQDGRKEMYLQINTIIIIININNLRNDTWKNFELIVPSKEEKGVFEKYSGLNIKSINVNSCQKTKLKHFQPFGFDLPTNILTKSTKIGNSNKLLQEWYSTMQYDVISALGTWSWRWTVEADLTNNEMRPLKTYYLTDGQEIEYEMYRRTQHASWKTTSDLDQKLSGNVEWYQDLNWFQIPSICK